MSAFGSSVFRRGEWSLLLLVLADCGGRSAAVCVVPAGTYVTHFTHSGSAVPCPNIPDQMLTIDGDGTIAGSSDAADGGSPRDQVDVDSSTCTSSRTMDTVDGPSGIRTISSTTIMLHGGSVSGKETIDTTNPTAFPHCSYDITLTESGG
jgi:hypothetical protein